MSNEVVCINNRFTSTYVCNKYVGTSGGGVSHEGCDAVTLAYDVNEQFTAILFVSL